MKNLLYLLLISILFSCKDDKPVNKKNKQDIITSINKLKTNDVKLDEPEAGDWLYTHKEKGQTFQQYSLLTPIQVDDERKFIYIQPIGKFDTLQAKLIQYTADYMEIFFGIKTIVSAPISDAIIPDSARRNKEYGNEQLLAPYILDKVLKDRLPNDALAVMALTAQDLYPQPSWMYVFGLSSYHNRVSVTSIYRFNNYDMNGSNYSQCLRRLINTSAHEIGHMFSMHHCTNAHCTMNGANNLEENDESPCRLCSECMGKMLYNFDIQPIERFKKLQAYFEKHHLTEEAQMAKKDLETL